MKLPIWNGPCRVCGKPCSMLCQDTIHEECKDKENETLALIGSIEPDRLVTALKKGMDKRLTEAAKKVVDARYGGGEWDKLSEAIGELGDVLKSMGVKCKGIE